MVKIRQGPLISELAVEIRGCREEEKDSINVGKDKDEEEAAVIKSRGPHLAKGELMPSNKLAISGGSGLV